MKTFLTACSLVLLLLGTAVAQDKPRIRGRAGLRGRGRAARRFDAHQEETFAMLHPGAPQYNTLMRVDPSDKTGTKVIGDLAESWTISQRSTHVHVQGPQGREVPRRQRDDGE